MALLEISGVNGRDAFLDEGRRVQAVRSHHIGITTWVCGGPLPILVNFSVARPAVDLDMPSVAVVLGGVRPDGTQLVLLQNQARGDPARVFNPVNTQWEDLALQPDLIHPPWWWVRDLPHGIVALPRAACLSGHDDWLWRIAGGPNSFALFESVAKGAVRICDDRRPCSGHAAPGI